MDRDLVASDYSCNTSRTQSLSEGVAYFLRLTVLGVWYFLLLTLSLSLSITQTLHKYNPELDY